MESQLSLHLRAFNNRVKVMNQTNAKDLTLSKLEAQNLQADIFELLTQIQELAEVKKVQVEQDIVTIQLDGGEFQ
jgi:hypothetical protein